MILDNDSKLKSSERKCCIQTLKMRLAGIPQELLSTGFAQSDMRNQEPRNYTFSQQIKPMWKISRQPLKSVQPLASIGGDIIDGEITNYLNAE